MAEIELNEEMTKDFLTALKTLITLTLQDNLEIRLDKSRGEIEAKLTLFGETISTDRIYL